MFKEQMHILLGAKLQLDNWQIYIDSNDVCGIVITLFLKCIPLTRTVF